MRSGIARILTDRRIHPKYYKRLAAQAVYPRIRLKFLDFPIFLDLNALDRPDHAVINLRNLKETSKMPRGHAACQNSGPTRPLFSRSYWNSSCCQQKREIFHRRGQHLCLVQERKVENEECF